MDENVDYDERESEFDIEDEDRSVQLNEEEKLGDDIEVRNIFILDSIRQEQKQYISLLVLQYYVSQAYVIIFGIIDVCRNSNPTISVKYG